MPDNSREFYVSRFACYGCIGRRILQVGHYSTQHR